MGDPHCKPNRLDGLTYLLLVLDILLQVNTSIVKIQLDGTLSDEAANYVAQYLSNRSGLQFALHVTSLKSVASIPSWIQSLKTTRISNVMVSIQKMPPFTPLLLSRMFEAAMCNFNMSQVAFECNSSRILHVTTAEPWPMADRHAIVRLRSNHFAASALNRGDYNDMGRISVPWDTIVSSRELWRRFDGIVYEGTCGSSPALLKRLFRGGILEQQLRFYCAQEVILACKGFKFEYSKLPLHVAIQDRGDLDVWVVFPPMYRSPVEQVIATVPLETILDWVLVSFIIASTS